MTMEIRQAMGEIREINEGDHTFALRVVSYGVPDTYGTNWQPGVFDESLRSRVPSACWSHDWSRIIGSMVEHDSHAQGLDGLVRFADFDHVPDARMAWSLIKDKHIRDTSFGFKRRDWVDQRRDGSYTPGAGEKEQMRAARLDEVSPVLVGSVPGSQAFAVRSEGRVARADAGMLLTQLATGKITLIDALKSLEARVEAAEAEPEGEPVEPPNENPEPPTVDITEEQARWALIESVFDAGNRRAALAVEDELRIDTAPVATERLMRYWSAGAGGAKIRWGVPGDFARCEVELGKYVKPEQLKGLCANLHHRATGAWPGHAPGEGGK